MSVILQSIFLITLVFLVSSHRVFLESYFNGGRPFPTKARWILMLDAGLLFWGYVFLRAILGANVSWRDAGLLVLGYTVLRWEPVFWSHPLDRLRRLPIRKVALYCVILAFPYVIAEVVFTADYLRRPPDVAWFVDGPADTFQFDPVFGFRVGRTRVRSLDLYHGKKEILSTFAGNNLGLLDRDDFGPKGDNPREKRILVLGDSFTAGSYLEMNWPDRTERLLREQGESIKLLNFAMPGYGLANWWSQWVRYLEPERFEFQGVVLAIYRSDIARGFATTRSENGKIFPNATFPIFPESLPVDESDVLFRQKPTSFAGERVSPEEFDGLLVGKWPDRLTKRPFRLEFATRMIEGLRSLRSPHKEFRRCPEIPFKDAQRQLLASLQKRIQGRGVPTLVVYIPNLSEMIDPLGHESCASASLEVARMLGAQFFDGRKVFEELTMEQKRASFFPKDGHWNQSGSDRFAEKMAELLSKRANPQFHS